MAGLPAGWQVEAANSTYTMTRSSARTTPVRSGETGSPGGTRSRLSGLQSSPTARRRWLVLFALVVIAAVAVAVNIGPLTRYQDARARLQGVTADVDALKTQKTQLQAQLAKLSEAGYLETLAREQLSYARPGEELYIVPSVSDASGLGVGAMGDLGEAATTAPPADTETAAGTGSATGVGSATGAGSGDTGAGDRSPGVLERIISGIRGLF
jgi:cell division protein FtsB